MLSHSYTPCPRALQTCTILSFLVIFTTLHHTAAQQHHHTNNTKPPQVHDHHLPNAQLPISIYRGLSSLSYVASSPHPAWFDTLVILDAAHYRVLSCDIDTGAIRSEWNLPGYETGYYAETPYQSIDICATDGSIYISLYWKVYIFDVQGNIQHIINITTGANDIAVAHDGTFFTVNYGTPGTIVHYSLSGSVLQTFPASVDDLSVLMVVLSPDANATTGSVFYTGTNAYPKLQTVIIEIDIATAKNKVWGAQLIPYISAPVALARGATTGDIYVYDHPNKRVLVFSPNGTVVRTFATLSTNYPDQYQLSSTVDSHTNLWISAIDDYPVTSYDVNGRARRWSYRYPSFYQPATLTMQQNSSHVLVTTNTDIIMLSDGGGVETSWDLTDIPCFPTDIAVDAAGVIYCICGSEYVTAYRIDPISHKKRAIRVTSANGNVLTPSHVHVDMTGSVYFDDGGARTVVKVDPNTYTITQTFHITPTNKDDRIQAITVDQQGDVYIGVEMEPVVYRVSNTGVQLNISYSSAQLANVYSVTVSRTGDVYLCGTSPSPNRIGYIVVFNNQGVQQQIYQLSIAETVGICAVAIDDNTGLMYGLDQHAERVLVWNTEKQQKNNHNMDVYVQQA